jgi:hypothetical protein
MNEILHGMYDMPKKHKIRDSWWKKKRNSQNAMRRLTILISHVYVVCIHTARHVYTVDYATEKLEKRDSQKMQIAKNEIRTLTILINSSKNLKLLCKHNTDEYFNHKNRVIRLILAQHGKGSPSKKPWETHFFFLWS